MEKGAHRWLEPDMISWGLFLYYVIANDGLLGQQAPEFTAIGHHYIGQCTRVLPGWCCMRRYRTRHAKIETGVATMLGRGVRP